MDATRTLEAHQAPEQLGGFVKVYRKLLTSDVAGDSTAMGVWVWCLLKATHKPIKYRGATLQPGQFRTTQRRGAEENGLAPRTFYDVMKRLECARYIAQTPANQGTLVTICNWGTYQDAKDDARQPSAQQQNKKERN